MKIVDKNEVLHSRQSVGSIAPGSTFRYGGDIFIAVAPHYQLTFRVRDAVWAVNLADGMRHHMSRNLLVEPVDAVLTWEHKS